MKILVVDDDSSKFEGIRAVLLEAGVSDQVIDLAKTGVEARRNLSDTEYDLLILDIALPMREGDSPDRRGGVKLLEEIVERGNLRLPLSVVGLTAYAELHEEFGTQFHSRLWTLDYYDTSDNGWLERLRAKASYVLARSRQKREKQFEVDLCVVTALRSPELAALRRLELNWKAAQSLDEVGFYYEGQLENKGKYRSVVAAAAPRMGMVASALLCQKMVMKFRPKYLCMVGICAGVRGRCEIGDVLVADPAWDWQMGKHDSEEFSFAPDQIDLPTPLTERIRQLGECRDWLISSHDDYPGKKPANIPKIKVGPVASGSSVLADAKYVTEIQRQHRYLLGIEMELYGVYAACRDVSAPQPMAFGIKSVADFADDTKSDIYQEYAAHVSVQALKQFCMRYLFE